MDALERVLKKDFPELSVDVPSIPETSDIKPDELSKVLQYIKKNKLVQDSTSLLASTEPMRSSVSYPIIFPNQERDINFRVDWIHASMVYVGYIQSLNHVGDNNVQVKLYGMRLE
ncbi:MAG: hypothetical protein ABIC91_05460 [Nanoarchaeota archaeon]|nr:hypothetical protein [Nanoarchaeota archaeon]MBU1031012.1 hypothetical protein [Nanoarchaeota archaeon]